MKITIDLAMNNLSGILTEATEEEESVCYVTEDDAETLQVAIDTMRKYKKIEEIVSNYGFDTSWLCLRKIREVMEDRNGR